MNLEFIKPQNLGSLLMKSSQSNFDLRSPSSQLSNYYCKLNKGQGGRQYVKCLRLFTLGGQVVKLGKICSTQLLNGLLYLILFVASAHFFDVVLNPRHRGGHCKSKRLILNSKEMYNNICFSSLVQCAKRGPKIEQN